MTGRLVLLNGPSSAGKSTLAQAFAASMPTPWIVFPVDLLHHARSRPDQRPEGTTMTDADWQETFRRTRAGYHRALAGLAAAGNDVVGDHVLNEPWRIEDLVQVCADVPTLLVHVTAQVSELRRREIERGDREIGAAELQLTQVFRHGDCDLTIDTTGRTPADLAAQLRDAVDDWPTTTAFERLAAAG